MSQKIGETGMTGIGYSGFAEITNISVILAKQNELKGNSL